VGRVRVTCLDSINIRVGFVLYMFMHSGQSG